MSESKMVTEREAVIRERAAFMDGCAWVDAQEPSRALLSQAVREATTRYPLPGVTPFAKKSEDTP